ncbi:MAG: hypothetical protein M1820_001176 [Bogoriella megaspora]|nr:MAG: hypothetical protein M1820_001176 [Bogoriella megaspora]
MSPISKLAVLAFAAVAVVVNAHPGHDPAEEIAQRAAYFSIPHHKRAIARRQAHIQELQEQRSIKQLRARDYESVLNTTHHSNLTGLALDTDPSVLFASDNSSCVLTPEVTEGPYYVEGEYVRQNITEDQAGVALRLDVQIIDVETCEPISGVMLEAWHCNATGVYGGIVASGNGNSDDATNINRTSLRGLQQSKDDGALTFDTIVPGHYVGRTNHMHVLAHLNATVLPNDTITGGTISHVGQLFFDQDLLEEVETTSPYSTNTQDVTTNAEDSIFQQEATGFDPVVEYVLLGDTVDDGLLGWVSFGINITANYSVNPAATLTSEGGVADNSTGSGAGGPGGPPSSAL